MNFLDYIIFVCFTGVAIGLIFLIIGGFINYLTNGKFKDTVANFFSEEGSE